MLNKGFYYSIHGGGLHNLVRFLAICEIVNGAGVLKDTKTFKGKCNFPCEPDIFYERVAVYKDGAKKIKTKELYVVEIETKATNQSRKMKFEQYKNSLAGLTDLIVIDLNEEYIKWAIEREYTIPYDNWVALRDYVKYRLGL